MAVAVERTQERRRRFVWVSLFLSGVAATFPFLGPREGTRPWRTQAGAYRALAIGSDALVTLLVTASFALGAYPAPESLLLAVLAAAGFVLATASQRGYDTRRAGSGREEVKAILRAGGLLAVASMAVAYVDLLDLPRLLVFEALGATVALALTLRLLQRRVVQNLRLHHSLMRRTILVGAPDALAPVMDSLGGDPRHGFAVVGMCTPSAGTAAGGDPAVPPDVPVLGTLQDVPRLIREHGADAVVVAASAMRADELRRLCWRVEGLGAELLLAPNLAEVAPSRLTFHPVSGTPLIALAVGPTRARRWGKAVLDRVLGTLLLLLSLPVAVPAGLMVRLTSPGPALFRQVRVGADGVPFTMLKLRTMVTDAEAARDRLLPLSDGNETLFKLRLDPRMTRVGRVLRRFSVDELPQLWNVVRGDMSLVGPRPPLREEVARYDDMAYHRLHVKPGMTGLWQVSGRSDLAWAESVRLDLRYVDNWSLGMDLAILWRTVRAVLGGRGAY